MVHSFVLVLPQHASIQTRILQEKQKQRRRQQFATSKQQQEQQQQQYTTNPSSSNSFLSASSSVSLLPIGFTAPHNTTTTATGMNIPSPLQFGSQNDSLLESLQQQLKQKDILHERAIQSLTLQHQSHQVMMQVRMVEMQHQLKRQYLQSAQQQAQLILNAHAREANLQNQVNSLQDQLAKQQQQLSNATTLSSSLTNVTTINADNNNETIVWNQKWQAEVERLEEEVKIAFKMGRELSARVQQDLMSQLQDKEAALEEAHELLNILRLELQEYQDEMTSLTPKQLRQRQEWKRREQQNVRNFNNDDDEERRSAVRSLVLARKQLVSKLQNIKRGILSIGQRQQQRNKKNVQHEEVWVGHSAGQRQKEL